MKIHHHHFILAAILLASTVANADEALAPAHTQCSLYSEPGTYEVTVPWLTVVDLCAKDGYKIEKSMSMAIQAGWVMLQDGDKLWFGAFKESEPTNIVVHFVDGSRAEYRIKAQANGLMAVNPVSPK